MERVLETVPFEPGQSILDVGANTCWAAATFARIGLRAVALDISMVEMQGLRTADWWFEQDGTYFERVLGSFKLAAVNVARQRAFVRRVHMWWRYLMGPQVSLQMVCTKSAAASTSPDVTGARLIARGRHDL